MSLRPILRHPADIYPVLVTLSITAVQVSLFLWVHDLRWLVVAVVLFAPFQSISNAIAHNHYHTPAFTARPLNLLYEVFIFFQCGLPSYGWPLNHVLGHHTNFRNQTHGTATHDEYHWISKDGRITGRLVYTIRTAILSHVYIWRNGRQYPEMRRRWLLVLAFNATVLAALIAWRPLPAIIVFLIPMQFMTFVMAWYSYVHHVGLESDDEYAISYTNLSRFNNIVTFNTGYHAAHHLKPGLHWSKLPEFHESISHRIPAHCYHDGDVPAAVRERVTSGAPARPPLLVAAAKGE